MSRRKKYRFIRPSVLTDGAESTFSHGAVDCMLLCTCSVISIFVSLMSCNFLCYYFSSVSIVAVLPRPSPGPLQGA